MSDSQPAAAPTSGTTSPDPIPSFDDLVADPEIAALLDFEPAPRKVERPDGWTADLQRELIARIADTGSPGHACDAMDKNLSGAKHLYRTEGADSFRAAWQAAIALAAGRKRAARAAILRHPVDVPGIERPRRASAQLDVNGQAQQPRQVPNEHGEWEDEASFLRRGEEAKDSIGNKLVRSRRLYLMSIAGEPIKRAAFEILTELPVDWELAKKMRPQPFEPWHRPNAHEPDMVLTAESG
jgi:hypothetical protein